jgi:antitoxin HicB
MEANTMTNSQIQYSMLIEWSEADQAYLVTLPEWAQQVIMPVTHGNTYDEAVKNGREVLEMLISNAQKNGDLLPQPRIHAA